MPWLLNILTKISQVSWPFQDSDFQKYVQKSYDIQLPSQHKLISSGFTYIKILLKI